MNIKIVSRYDESKILLCGEYESIKDCLEKNKGAYLEGAYLRGVNLAGANLGGANLAGVNLAGAYLGGAKNYVSNHDFFAEIIRRQKLETFTEKEWAMIGRIIIHRLCWDTIKKRYGKRIMPMFKKLSKTGYDGWEIKYKEILKG